MNLLLLCVCILLLAFSGFFSASETALMSLSRTDLRRLSQRGDRIGRYVCGLLGRPQRLLRTILVGNMFVNVLFASFFATLLNNWLSSGESGAFERLFRYCFPAMESDTVLRLGGVCRMLLNIVIVTPALMLCGEQTPKVVAFAQNISVSRFAAPLLNVLCVILAPVNWLLSLVANVLLKLIGQNTEDKWEKMTADELISSLSVSENSGATSEPEWRMLSRIVDFGSICVDEVMTPRVRVTGLDDRMTLREAYIIARRQGHSWYPVFHQNLDGVWGMLSLVDYPFWNNRREMDLPLSDMRKQLSNGQDGHQAIYRPRFVPVTARVDMLLQSMRQEARSVVIVVDEHGGMEGMVTLNDIVAELLGTMPKHEEPLIKACDNGHYLCDGLCHLRLLLKQLDFLEELEGDDSTTLGGAVVSRLGRIPLADEQVVLANGTILRVTRTYRQRVSEVEIIPVAVLGKKQEALS